MKLFSISNTFSKSQWTGFITYVQLYHRQNSTVYKTVEWLNEQKLWKIEIEDHLVVDHLLSNVPFETKPKTFINTLTILGNIAEEYVGWIEWKSTPDLKRSCQLKGLAKKSLTDEYIKTQKEVLKEPEDKVISIWDEYYKMRTLFDDYYYQINESDDNYTETFSKLLNSFRHSTSLIGQILMVEIKNREKLLAESWHEYKDIFEPIFRNETQLSYISEEIIQMNYFGKEEAYQNLQSVLKEQKTQNFSKHIKYIIAIYSINFLTRIIKKGEMQRAQELLELYEFTLENEIFTLDDSLPFNRFINVIGFASKLGRNEWARNMITILAKKVDRLKYKEIQKLGFALIDFNQEEYEKVIDSLTHIKLTNFRYRLKSRWLLLRAQFEYNREYIDVIKTQINNFRRFVVSNESRINKSTYEGLKTTIKILNMLLVRNESKQIEAFYKNSTYVFERKWIFEKIKKPV